jgi:eukaryotic-like serine/threonine-protein kinase
MAPEQWRNSSGVGARADVYALGSTLWFMLTGAPPARAGRPPLREKRPDAPVALEAVLERLLVVRPEWRFASAAAVATTLEPFAVSSMMFTRRRQMGSSCIRL